MAECNRCLLNDDIKGITIGDSGQCSFCDLHDNIEKSTKNIDINEIVKEIKKKGGKNKYDCIIGLSGGFDSSYMLHLAVKVYGLRPLVIHFDNGWNSEDSKNNMKVMVEGTGVDFLTFSINNKELNELNAAFLKSGVSDADIPNDMAMSKMFFDIAKKFNIKSILNGHNYKYEGSIPLAWSYMDSKYIQSVAKYYNINIGSYPILSFWDQIKSMINGYKTYRFLYYIEHDKNEMKKMLSDLYGWIDYGGNHGENVYSEFIGNYLLPNKFGINKRIVYKSAELRSGFISRAEAIEGIKTPLFDVKKIERIEKELGLTLEQIMNYPITDRKRFDSYHKEFKKWRFLILIGTKLGYFPRTFYKKYCL